MKLVLISLLIAWLIGVCIVVFSCLKIAAEADEMMDQINRRKGDEEKR